MAQIRVRVELPSIREWRGIVDQTVFPLLTQAVRVIAQATAIKWQEEVMRAKLWSGEKDAYQKSITASMTGPFAAVVTASYKYAAEIEDGRPPRDLKAMLQTSLKVRVNKKGRRYLIIPFRHGTPGTNSNPMPLSVYTLAKALDPSRVTAMGARPSQQPGKSQVMVPQRSYSWGGRLQAGLMPLAKPHHQTDLYAGMVRFNTGSGRQKSSAYLTFRVMSEDSPGWVIPAQPGQYIAKRVADEMQPMAEKAFAEAVRRSV